MRRSLYVWSGAAAVAILILGLLSKDASLLPGLLFWTAVGQGILALCAAGDLTKARWLAPVKEQLLSVHPYLLLFPVAFLIFSRNIAIYPWAEHPGGWLSPGFFVIRNVAALLLTWFVGRTYAKAALRGADSTRTLAAFYALVFVLNQSLIAFDWVMSFEYPWVSTLFGGYFFIEALYAGIAFTAAVLALLAWRSRDELEASLRDSATLLFGFALLWAGQMFAQYLVIWYGNIPEEAGFLARRVAESPLRELSTAVLFTLFVIPFVVLLSRKAKTTPWIVLAMAKLVFIGILIERLVLLIPVTEMNFPLTMLGLIVLGIPLQATVLAQTIHERPS